ncbi:MAG: transposase, partial [Oscillospiraceae bacterium]|nr:transposase [Oscillospiraceae bacterium]
YKGKIARPWLSAWMDVKSRYIVGYVLNVVDPNADIVLDSFADAIKNCGVPDSVQIDNGKDYKVHDLFNVDNDYSLVSIMKAAVITSNPYNAKVKPIERFFETFEGYNKMLPSYIGDRPENRPTSMRGTNIMIERENKAMDFEEFKKHVANILNIYHNTKHGGNGMDKRTPYEVFRNSFIKPMRVLNEAARRLLLRRTTRTVAITKQGVKFAELPNIKFYSSDELIFYGIGKKVYARYDTNDVTEVYIYSESGEYICTAQNDTLNVYGAGKEVTSQTIRENNNRKKQLYKKAKSFYPNDIEVPGIVEVAEKRSAAFGAPDFSKISKTDCSEEFEVSKPSEKIEKAEEYAYPEKDYRLNLGNIGKTAM